MSHKIKINYKEYPEYMFVMITAFLPEEEGDYLRKISGDVVFRHTDKDGNTYKNGARHSYNDIPSYTSYNYKSWHKDGKLHRDGDQPAFIKGNIKQWYRNGNLHRDGDQPAIINGNNKVWFTNGVITKI